MVDPPLNFDRAASGFDEAPPLLGEDTEAVLQELGYDAGAIDAVREAGGIPNR